ncbi:uncharacterized protein LOC125487828 [Rhincodon typus]|uniref:uncharacterized protein LOC125487828 n=1 Tax=Rhincodon typus TaxID=259920 RepID=UPI00202E478D|nr:uncharacterized protein LOC125487828 [Rhincodon typus]
MGRRRAFQSLENGGGAACEEKKKTRYYKPPCPKLATPPRSSDGVYTSMWTLVGLVRTMALQRISLLLLLMTVALCWAKDPLSCPPKSGEMIVQVGGSVVMPCMFNWLGSMPESRRALWQKKSEHGSSLVVHVRDMGTENVNQDKEFSGRTSLPADWFEKKDLSLTLTQVSMSDAGDYECHVVTQRPHASNVCMDFKLTVTSDAAEATTIPCILLLMGLAFVPLFS